MLHPIPMLICYFYPFFPFAWTKTALVHCLFQLYHEGTRSNSGEIALLIYKRGIKLSRNNIQWLENSLRVETLTPPPLSISHKPPISLHISECSCMSQNILSEASVDWCKVFSRLNVLSPHNSVSCPYVEEQVQSYHVEKVKQQSSLIDDEFNLIVENETIIAHKSIVSARSGKLAAGIRFSEARQDIPAERLSVHIDLPLTVARMLLSHIYTGSIAFGLKSGQLLCYQLLELALLAEEYLCPTLMLECEIRLLKYGRKCICPHCIAHNFGNRYIIDTPSSDLITFETALDVIAVAQQLEESASAPIYHSKEVDNIQNSTAPFHVAKLTAAAVILMNFKAVLCSRSFMRQTQSDGTDEYVMDVFCCENSILLLSMCLEELKHNALVSHTHQECHVVGDTMKES